MKIRIGKSLAYLVLPLCLLACSQSESLKLDAQDFSENSSCELDGMLLAEYPGPKAQIIYQGQTTAVYFCDTLELIHTLLAPEQKRVISAAYVQNMAKADWNKPQGNWIKAQDAWYVQGSKQHGSMGPTLASFAAQAEAQQFAKEYGGNVMAFHDLNLDMVDLSGGALHDSKM